VPRFVVAGVRGRDTRARESESERARPSREVKVCSRRVVVVVVVGSSSSVRAHRRGRCPGEKSEGSARCHVRAGEFVDMRDRVGKFLCVVPPKTLRVNHADGSAARVGGEDALEDALNALEFKKSSSALDGGGVAIGVGPGIQAFTDNELIVSFVGHLTNVDYLAWRLFSDEGRRGDRAPSALEAARQLVGGRCYEAELVCHLYKTFGTKALPKLRGKFAFVVFDSKSVRVFAARDVSGDYDLKFAKDDDGTVIVSNFDGASELMPSKRGMSDVPPGCYVYGHRSISPNRFAKTLAEKSSELAAAVAAAERALRGLNVKSRRSTRASLDEERERTLCDDTMRALDDLDGGHEFESHDRAIEVEEGEPGTEEDHRQAEVVAIKTASAAIKRIASGVNMTGMVRMDGFNALAAVGLRASDTTDPASKDFKLDRVPSRSGLLSEMVKVASFGNLKNVNTGSLTNRAHNAVSSPKKGLSAHNRRGSWADMTLLVASGESKQENEGDDDT